MTWIDNSDLPLHYELEHDSYLVADIFPALETKTGGLMWRAVVICFAPTGDIEQWFFYLADAKAWAEKTAKELHE